MSVAVVRIDQASASIGKVVLLDNLTLSIDVGERIAIIGPNGAGKSSLLKLIGGALAPSTGHVDVLGQPLHRARSGKTMRQFQAQVGQIFQGLHLIQRLSALENVLLGSLARNRSWLTWARVFPAVDVQRAHDALSRVGLNGKAATRVDRLSGGERQKVAIARMLLQDAPLVLADEPTAALDPTAATDIAIMLAAIASAQRMTLVSVVHDPGLLPLLANRVIGMRNGTIVFDLPVARVDDILLGELYRDAAVAPRFQPVSFSDGKIA